MLQKIKDNFSLDLRALALLRIGVALVLILDLSIRISDLRVFFSDEGIMPLYAMFANNWNSYYFSIYTISGNWAMILFLFILNYAFAIMLLAGYRTRLATFLCWIFLLSLDNRNTLILQAGDDYLRMLLFWGMFLPWGNRYSIDSNNRDAPINSKKYFSPAVVAYILQICSVYFFSALFKTGSEWTSEGTATYYALSLDQMVFPFGKWIYPYKELLKIVTFATYYLEMFAPFLLLIPVYTSTWRWIFIILLTLFHIGINLSLNVGLFSAISIIALIGLLPSNFMDWIERKLKIEYTYSNILTESKSYLKNALVIFFTLYCLTWNWGTVPQAGYALDGRSNWIGYLLRIDQSWGMFSPTVFKEDGWFVMEGKMKNDSLIDISKNGRKVDYRKPAYVASLFKNDRWRKYSENVIMASNTWMRTYYCNYLSREWNWNHPKQHINHFRLIYMKELSSPDYKYVKPELIVISECN